MALGFEFCFRTTKCALSSTGPAPLHYEVKPPPKKCAFSLILALQPPQTASLQSSEYAAWHAVQVPDVPPPLAPPLAPPSAPQSRVAPEDSSEDPGDGWCLETMRKHGVTPGKSWGSLPKHQEAEWAARKCDRFAGQTASWIERGAKKGGVQERLASGLKDPRLAVAEGGGQEDSGDWCRQAMWKFDVR